MSEDQVETAYEVSAADPDQAFAWIAARIQAIGLSTNSLVVAPADSRAAVALAGLTAKRHGALFAPAGSVSTLTVNSRANAFLNLWRSETESVTLVGVDLTGTHLSAVASPTLTSHASAPAFRVLDVSKSGSNYTFAFTAVTGATIYKMFDRYGDLITSSPAPSLTSPAQINAVLVIAEDSFGELERVDVRLNDYTDASSRRSALVGSTAGGTNHIVFLDGIEVPRLVSRTVADPFAMDPSPSAPLPVAITCEPTFTDSGLDATKQYAYIVEEMTNVDAHACDPSHPMAQAIAEERIVSQVTLPLTSFPWLRGESKPNMAVSTIAEKLLADLIADADGDTSGPGARSDETPLFFRWIAYIPEERIPFPAFSGDFTKPVVMFGGDNVTDPDPNISARFTQTIYMFFGEYNHGIAYAETMGTTHLYKCAAIGSGCSLVASATASLTELSQGSTVSTATTGKSGGIASASNPLVAVAPPIDVIWQITATETSLTLTGYHDNMPKHQLWFGTYPGHAYLGYSSPYLSAAQLPCLASYPGSPMSVCSIYFNFQL